MPELVFYRRGEEVLRFVLGQPRTVLGRGEGSDLVLPDPDISRAQAALVCEGDRVTLEDLSGKGTQVAGVHTHRAELADGVDFVIGQWRAVFRERASGELDSVTDPGRGRTDKQPQPAEEAQQQPAQLRLRRGHEETLHRIAGGALTVGTDEDNDVVLADRLASGKHLRIIRRGGRFQVVDRGSTNGTYLGNVRIHDAEVPLFTTLRIGEAELTLEPVTESRRESAFQGMIGSDPAMRQLMELIERVASSSAAVAVFGESGTGKELVAHAVHARSSRADKLFIPLNCAAISKELIESELFGHEKGSFTGAVSTRRGAFEEADGGTLFLDEIGELPFELQAKLLRALESGEIKRVGTSRPITVDVRVITATNVNLLAAVRKGAFREDLYYRLCVIPLHLPPLRARKGDVAAIAEHFLRVFSPRGQHVRFTHAALERLQAHHWPGNIRELRNVIHRALLLRKGPTIDEPDLSFDEELSPETGLPMPEFPLGMTLDQMMEKIERQIVESSLKRWQNNRERVARELGVGRSTLFKRLKGWGLTRQDEVE